ncbi:MAG: hypothetical protein AAB592_03430 [Patescibacteria group bacterium]
MKKIQLLSGVLSVAIGSVALIPGGEMARTPLLKILLYPFKIGEKILNIFDLFQYPVSNGIISLPVDNPRLTLIGTAIAIAVGLIIYFLIGVIAGTIVEKMMKKK